MHAKLTVTVCFSYSAFGLRIWFMRHGFNQNGSVWHFLWNELVSLRYHYLVLHGDKRSESMTQTKQLEEVRFLDRIILHGSIPLTKHDVNVWSTQNECLRSKWTLG